jgi:unsaturated chondroitin disaccharide hydrolase
MKKISLLTLNLIYFSFGSIAQKPIIEHATTQFNLAFEEIAKAKLKNPNGVSPRSMRADTLFLVPPKDWTSGFFAGNLWYMYELTNDKKWLQRAQEFTAPIENQKMDSTTHDLGFKLYCSFGNGYRLTKTPQYKDVLIQSARTLITRFNPKIGSLRSWDHHKEEWEFPVIIDNMMNLELLFWASKETKDSTFYKVAISHANTTMKNHYRADFSSYHVIGYDAKTGQVKQRNTHQGFNDESAWARGQSWGLYAFTMCFRETGDKTYLKHAENIANFILNYPNLPTDLVPYWDFNAPTIPNAPRDVSAATLMASAFYELSAYVPKKSELYIKTADKIMSSIAQKYTATPQSNKGFLLTNSTGHLPNNLEINVPIIYADYYYLEALLRKKNLAETPKTLQLDGAILAKNKQLIHTDAVKENALKNFLNKADKIVNAEKMYSVMNKTIVPPSGDKHDYMSQAPYWWADSTKPNGLPYIRRDGERNPELNKISDHAEMDNLEEDAQITALAYYFSQDERYAKHTAKLLKTWFLDKETRQNPHLNFGQGIPGINTGRGIGIIETRSIYKIIDAAILLRGSKNWSNDDHNGLKKWFSEYLTWLLESPIGKDEADEHNNHGTHYDVQVIALALFTDKPDLAKKQIEITKTRIASQLKPDGSQPHELARTTSWSYINMNLLGFFNIAQLAEHVDIDLWHYQTTDGKNLQKCVDWMLPYLKKEDKWHYEQIKKMEYDVTVELLRIASKKYQNPSYGALAKTIDMGTYQSDLGQLIF